MAKTRRQHRRSGVRTRRNRNPTRTIGKIRTQRYRVNKRNRAKRNRNTYKRNINTRKGNKRGGGKRTKKMIGGGGEVSFALQFQFNKANEPKFQGLYALWESTKEMGWLDKSKAKVGAKTKPKLYFQLISAKINEKETDKIAFNFGCAQSLNAITKNGEFLFEIKPATYYPQSKVTNYTEGVNIELDGIKDKESVESWRSGVYTIPESIKELTEFYKKLYESNERVLPQLAKDSLAEMFIGTYMKGGSNDYTLEHNYGKNVEPIFNAFQKMARDQDQDAVCAEEGEYGGVQSEPGTTMGDLPGGTIEESRANLAELIEDLRTSTILDVKSILAFGKKALAETMPKVQGMDYQDPGRLNIGQHEAHLIFYAKDDGYNKLLKDFYDISPMLNYQYLQNPRHMDILPSKKFAIKSNIEEDKFFNANYVFTDSSQFPRYIAAACPKQNNTDEDCVMKKLIEKTKPRYIVMVTKVFESSQKCYHYFSPDEFFERENYEEEQPPGDGFSLTIRRGIIKDSGVDIAHYHYESWTDHYVPNKKEGDIKTYIFDQGLLKIVDDCARHLETHGKTEEKRPIMVHCSAGVGRTGVTILMIELKRLVNKFVFSLSKGDTGQITGLTNMSFLNGLNLLTDQNEIVIKMLIYLRLFRPLLVQTDIQLHYILEYLVFITLIPRFTPPQKYKGNSPAADIGKDYIIIYKGRGKYSLVYLNEGLHTEVELNYKMVTAQDYQHYSEDFIRNNYKLTGGGIEMDIKYGQNEPVMDDFYKKIRAKRASGAPPPVVPSGVQGTASEEASVEPPPLLPRQGTAPASGAPPLLPRGKKVVVTRPERLVSELVSEAPPPLLPRQGTAPASGAGPPEGDYTTPDQIDRATERNRLIALMGENESSGNETDNNELPPVLTPVTYMGAVKLFGITKPGFYVRYSEKNKGYMLVYRNEGTNVEKRIPFVENGDMETADGKIQWRYKILSFPFIIWGSKLDRDEGGHFIANQLMNRPDYNKIIYNFIKTP